MACVSYDGFDETEQTQFPTMIEETAKIEEYIKEHYDGKICAAYGCSLGGSFVGLMAARGVIHMDYGILGGFGSGSVCKTAGEADDSPDAADDLSVSYDRHFGFRF